MRWARFYTQAGREVFTGARLRAVASEQRLEYIVPLRWAQGAVDVLLAKVFCPAALPALTKKVEEPGVPEWLWRNAPDQAGLDSISAEWRYRYEQDIREVLHRVAGAATYRAWKNGAFASEEDARVFYDELRHILLHQIAAPEPALWSSLGLDWAYGLAEAPFQAFRHHITLFEAGKPQALKRARLLGETLALDAGAPPAGVTLPVENADSPAFIAWKRNADVRRVAESLGQRILDAVAHRVMDACERGSIFGFDPSRNPGLRQAVEEARRAGLPETAIAAAVSYAAQGYEEISFTLPEEDGSVAEDRIAAALSVSDDFIEAALTGHSLLLYEGGAPARHCAAQKLWDELAEAVWASGSPAVSFRGAIEAANVTGKALAADAAGGFVFLPGSSAPAATLNLLAFAQGEDTILDVAALSHATRVMTVFLDAVGGGSEYRPLALGVTNVAALLMGKGLPYDSDAGRATAALAAALVSGSAHLASAEMAARQGAYPAYAPQAKAYLQAVKDRLAALSGASFLSKGMTRRPAQIRTALCPDAGLAAAAKEAWEGAYGLGKETGFRHAHLTAIGTDAATQALLGAQTQDIVSEQALVRFEGYFSDTLEGAQLYGKKLNPMVPRALSRLGYAAAEREDIHFYAVGHGTLLDAPHINHQSLREKGFHQAALDAVEAALASSLHIRYAFNRWTLGTEFCCRVLGFSEEELESGAFDMLAALGFSEDDIEAANTYCCGTMTLEGAPHLKPDHLAVFDCLAPCAASGVRRVPPQAQVRMQAALEPFLSGAVAHTVLLQHHATIEEVQKLILMGWELGLKSLRLYREGCSLLHPAAPPPEEKETVAATEEEEELPCPKQSISV